MALHKRGGTGLVRLLFIGEAPGEFEDYLGVPFVGRAGSILSVLFDFCRADFTYVITNTVCCRPVDVIYLDHSTDPATHDKLKRGTDYELMNFNREPTKEEMDLCRPHIDEILVDLDPHGVVYLGKTAQSYTKKHMAKLGKKLPTLSLHHPAYIARLEYKVQIVRKEAAKLSHFVETLYAKHH